MGQKSKWEYFKAIYDRYQKATLAIRTAILDEFCQVCHFNRKYAIRKLNGPRPEKLAKPFKRKRPPRYGPIVISILEEVWKHADYPCGVRLKVIIRDWFPWIQQMFHLSPAIEKQLLSISASTIDRRLKPKKNRIKKRIYGRTKPGSLLKHQIPIKTDNWDVKTPGYSEIDTVSHAGNNADGTFAYTVNDTDILTTWTESYAVLGKGETGIVYALDEIGKALPFKRRGLDSDNGSEFINWHLVKYCRKKKIQHFRGRPYKKDDNAHVEQKNWTSVRKQIGYGRYDTQTAIDAMNDLYRNEMHLFTNLFLPNVKLKEKKRVGSRQVRKYDAPQTPFERVKNSKQGDPKKVALYQQLRDTLNPFELNRIVYQKLTRIYKLGNRRQSPKQEKSS
jgi:hypothetical protein